MAIGGLIRQLRLDRDWSQHDLAEQLRYVSGRPTVTRETVSRWEQGHITPGRFWQTRLAAVYDVPIQLLRDELRRRPRPAGSIPDRILALQAARDRYERMYRHVGGVAVRPRLLEYVQTHATPLLRHHPEGATNTRADLVQAVAGLVALAGICAYDGDQQAAARRHYQYALDLGLSTGNHGFLGYLRSLLATQDVRTRNPAQAIGHVEAALSVYGQLTAALLTDLHCTRAEAHALLGDRTACRHAISAAYATAEKIDTTHEPAETGHVQPGVLEGRHAEVLRLLGDYRAADQYARASITTTPASHPRGQANRLTVLTGVLISARRYDEAAATGLELVEVTDTMESALFRQRLDTARRHVVEHRAGTPVIDEFCVRAEQLVRSPL